jgi:hypothetical protein
MLGQREGEVTNVDHTRPLLLGYIRRHLLTTDAELDEAKERLGLFAEIEGFTLGTVYVEHLETTPAAFEALVEAVDRYEVTAVVVPSMLHFALLSAPAAIKDRFEHITGARVLVAAASPQVRRTRRRAAD